MSINAIGKATTQFIRNNPKMVAATGIATVGGYLLGKASASEATPEQAKEKKTSIGKKILGFAIGAGIAVALTRIPGVRKLIQSAANKVSTNPKISQAVEHLKTSMTEFKEAGRNVIKTLKTKIFGDSTVAQKLTAEVHNVSSKINKEQVDVMIKSAKDHLRKLADERCYFTGDNKAFNEGFIHKTVNDLKAMYPEYAKYIQKQLAEAVKRYSFKV